MSREAPPPTLQFARQWTQPTTETAYPSLSRVTYPSGAFTSPSPSPLQPSRVPLSPSPLSGRKALHSSPAPPQHTPSSANTSPLPTRPSAVTAALLGSDDTPSRRDRGGTTPFTLSERRRSDVVASAVRRYDDVDNAGRLFWQEQARHFEEANAALRAELQAVYRAVEKRNHALQHRSNAFGEDGHDTIPKTKASVVSAEPSSNDHSTYAAPPSPYDELSYAIVVQQRNAARIELAQEREKTFLLRHRLRESEMEIERLEQRLRHHLRSTSSSNGNHTMPDGHGSNRSAQAGAHALSRHKPVGSQRTRVDSRERASSVSSAESSMSAHRLPSAQQQRKRASSSLSPSPSSPRPRSATRRQPSSQRQRSQTQDSVSSVSSNETEFAERPALPRGYARLVHRREVQAQRTIEGKHSEEYRSSSRDVMRSSNEERLRPQPKPHRKQHSLEASPVQKEEVNQSTYSDINRRASQQQQQQAQEHTAAPPRESEARALLSSLLAARQPSPHHTTDTSQVGVIKKGPADRTKPAFREGEEEKESSSSSGGALRHVFRSQLFRTTTNTGRLHSNDHDLDDQEGSNNHFSHDGPPLQQRHHNGMLPRSFTDHAAYIARQLVSPTPPLQPQPSPPRLESVSHVLGRKASQSGTWLSVSLTTMEDDESVGRNLSFAEDVAEASTARSTHRSFFL